MWILTEQSGVWCKVEGLPCPMMIAVAQSVKVDLLTLVWGPWFLLTFICGVYYSAVVKTPKVLVCCTPLNQTNTQNEQINKTFVILECGQREFPECGY